MVVRVFEGEDEFLRGMNVHCPEARDFPIEQIEFLLKTNVRWVRIHPLPSRKLRWKNRQGVSYLDAIEKFAQAGFNLILPIEVGVKDNVGVISGAHLSKFIDESYSESFKAVKQIETRISKHGRKVIYGVENEIDTKEWIAQSTPGVEWRATLPAWTKLSVDQGMKYKRLNNILEGIKEASPESATMVNFEADDPKENWNLTMSFAYSVEIIASKLRILDRAAPRRMNSYRMDIVTAMRRLRNVDIIGLDNYPNYLDKVPPKGEEIGTKVDEVVRMTRKPVLNVEFGYTRDEPFWKRLRPWGIKDYGRSLEEYQQIFFRNALGSIGNSASQGTFPWVLWLDPTKSSQPIEENGFSLMRLGFNHSLELTPALSYYVNWLNGITQSGGIADVTKTRLGQSLEEPTTR
jgi:hypothetical protein